jgi:hypothetical protein
MDWRRDCTRTKLQAVDVDEEGTEFQIEKGNNIESQPTQSGRM